MVNSYAYDSYGTAEESVESLAQRFRYTGREYDALTGLYHYRARAFDPETARFLQEDPLWFGAGDLKVYRMTWNNPVNWTDPSGMSAAEDGGLRGAIMKAAPGIAMADYGDSYRIDPIITACTAPNPAPTEPNPSCLLIRRACRNWNILR